MAESLIRRLSELKDVRRRCRIETGGGAQTRMWNERGELSAEVYIYFM